MARWLVIGSGGREHAIAWKLMKSPSVDAVWVSPGNGGTHTSTGMQNVPGASITEWLDVVREHRLDRVFVGPEVPLADGIVDRFNAEGIAVFGPSRAAAQLESSKAFSKAFMQRHGLPCARSVVVHSAQEGHAQIHERGFDTIVVKASGLAAGKGVVVPNTLHDALAAVDQFIEDGSVLIEQRLTGPEVSLMAFCDGKTARVMRPARDHKRLLDGNLGPNTGGMGAIAPADLAGTSLEEAERTFLQAAVDGMAEDGHPFVGVLYAGLMLTPDGPKLLEYNVRFGDPETQVLLPLLKTDLTTVVEACLMGTLDTLVLEWHTQVAATVVMASEGYPASSITGRRIDGLEHAANATVFHAGTRATQTSLVTSGGRVLACTGIAETLQTALAQAYAAVDAIRFEGAQSRRDIGRSS